MNGDNSTRPTRLALGLTVDDAIRSISASPQPPMSSTSPGGSFVQGEEDMLYGDHGDHDDMIGEDSQFGRAKSGLKSKRKAAPRTSRACLACRRQKMRCEGAEDPPCRRCITNEVDCMFERRSDYLLNPEDRAWQNGVEKRLDHLGKAIDQILAHLGGGGLPPMTTASTTTSTASTFPEMPQTTFYDHHHHQQQQQQYHDRSVIQLPNTAPMSSDVSGQGRINYLIPTSSETAAIAAQSRLKRPRGNTAPGTLSSEPFHTNTAFQLFSPRAALAEPITADGLPTPYHFQLHEQHQMHDPHSHQQSSPSHHQHTDHHHHLQQQQAATYASHSHNSYSLDNYAHGNETATNNNNNPAAAAADTTTAAPDLQVSVPRSLNTSSPTS